MAGGTGALPTSARSARLKDSWRAASLRSTFGVQCLAQLPTGPACGFGSSLREANTRVSALALWRTPLQGYGCPRKYVPQKAQRGPATEPRRAEAIVCLCECNEPPQTATGSLSK